MINEDYKISMQHWFKSMEYSIEQIEKSNEHLRYEIELHKKHIKVNNLQLNHDKKRLEESKQDYEKYLVDNKD